LRLIVSKGDSDIPSAGVGGTLQVSKKFSFQITIYE
jgi:hypothetical protein